MGWKSLEIRREYERKYRAANRERIRLANRAYMRRHRVEHPEVGKRASQKWREKNREAINAKQRLQRTGCTPEQYQRALIEQNNLCAICQQPFKGNRGLLMPCADHDHRTMQFRGLLHQKCNRGLGHFNDSVHLLERAAAYLKRFI